MEKSVAVTLLVSAAFVFCAGYLAGKLSGPEAGYEAAWADYERGFNDGTGSPDDTDRQDLGLPPLQKSESQIEGNIFDGVQELLCRKDIAFDNENWQIMCPECGDAVISKSIVTHTILCSPDPFEHLPLYYPDAVYYRNYALIREHERVYCHCGYPLGTDWKIIDLSKQDANDIEWKELWLDGPVNPNDSNDGVDVDSNGIVIRE